MEIVGSDGQIELFDNRVVISRKGFFAMLFHKFAPPIEIPLKSVGIVEFVEATNFRAGSIKITYNVSEKQEIKFNKKNNPEFLSLKSDLMNKIQSA